MKILKITLRCIGFALLTLVTSCINKNSDGPIFGNDSIHGTFLDTRDGHNYKTVKISHQTWLAENLSYNISPGSFLFLDNSANEGTYGRLYTYSSAKAAVPPGWHLPSDDEIYELIEYCGGAIYAGNLLKESGSLHWINSGGGNNLSGFTALPSGYFNGGFIGLTDCFVCWGTSSDGTNSVYGLKLQSKDAKAYLNDYTGIFNLALAVRCIQGEAKPPCDNKGSICFENRLDSTLNLTITEAQLQISLKKYYMDCRNLVAGKTYNIFYQSIELYGDTSIYLNPCDNLLIIFKK